MMSDSLRSLNKAETEEVLRDYAPHFPGWVRHKKDAYYRQQFRRAAGPVMQSVMFETPSWRCYRPMHGLRVLAAPREPGGFVFVEHLPGRHAGGQAPSHIDYLGHKRDLPRAVADLRSHFLPTPDEPLDLRIALATVERLSHSTTPQLYELGPLYAYLGMTRAARRACAQYLLKAAEDERYFGVPDTSRSCDFVVALQSALERGDVRTLLDPIIEQEMRKEKLVD